MRGACTTAINVCKADNSTRLENNMLPQGASQGMEVEINKLVRTWGAATNLVICFACENK